MCTTNQDKKEKLIIAWESGKTIQSKSSGKWEDFEKHNQLDKPNWEYGGIENWRIKHEDCNNCNCKKK